MSAESVPAARLSAGARAAETERRTRLAQIEQLAAPVLVLGVVFFTLDEVSLAAPTMVRIVRGDEYETREWSPDEFGLEPVSVRSIRAAGPAESAALIRGILHGEDGPARGDGLGPAGGVQPRVGAATAVETGAGECEERPVDQPRRLHTNTPPANASPASANQVSA